MRVEQKATRTRDWLAGGAERVHTDAPFRLTLVPCLVPLGRLDSGEKVSRVNAAARQSPTMGIKSRLSKAKIRTPVDWKEHLVQFVAVEFLIVVAWWLVSTIIGIDQQVRDWGLLFAFIAAMFAIVWYMRGRNPSMPTSIEPSTDTAIDNLAETVKRWLEESGNPVQTVEQAGRYFHFGFYRSNWPFNISLDKSGPDASWIILSIVLMPELGEDLTDPGKTTFLDGLRRDLYLLRLEHENLAHPMDKPVIVKARIAIETLTKQIFVDRLVDVIHFPMVWNVNLRSAQRELGLPQTNWTVEAKMLKLGASK